MSSLAVLLSTSQRVGATRARSVKTRELADYLRTVPHEELELAVHYLSGSLPQGRFGMSYRMLHAATGDIAALESSLSLVDVDRRLQEVADLRGAGSTARRTVALHELFALATPDEQAFLIRMIVGELRQGALAGVMLDAIAAAAALPMALIRRAAMYAPSLGALARAAVSEGREGIERFDLQLFAPIAPMLAQTAADPTEALGQLTGEVVFEWKMDGARIQVHKRGDEIRIYTRALNEITPAIPDIVALLRKLTAHDVILDGEAIAFTDSGRPHAFQVTMRRFGRKLDVARLVDEQPLRAYFFDCLMLNGRALVERPLSERVAALHGVVPTDMLIPRIVAPSIAEANVFYDVALAAGHEGVMAKALEAPYEAGNRGASWLKIKRAHTLDLIVLAAEWGHGRRKGKLSNLHLGARDPATGDYVMLGKTFKGLTDALLEWQTTELLARQTHGDQWTVHVRPELVVEIAFSDLQASPRYPGGLALRLARVKRYREDKSAAEADTMDSVRRIFAAQG